MRTVPSGRPGLCRPLPRRPLASATLAGLLAILAACGRAPTRPARPALDAAAVTSRVRVYLIALHDGGRSGIHVACGDSAVPVDVSLAAPGPALAGALHALLSGGDRFDRGSGLYNPLYASPLKLVGIERTGANLRVRLAGYLESGGECDGPRILAQLERTALQFPQVHHVEFFLEGEPLAALLSGREPAPAPAVGTESPAVSAGMERSGGNSPSR